MFNNELKIVLGLAFLLVSGCARQPLDTNTIAAVQAMESNSDIGGAMLSVVYSSNKTSVLSYQYILGYTGIEFVITNSLSNETSRIWLQQTDEVEKGIVSFKEAENHAGAVILKDLPPGNYSISSINAYYNTSLSIGLPDHLTMVPATGMVGLEETAIPLEDIETDFTISPSEISYLGSFRLYSVFKKEEVQLTMPRRNQRIHKQQEIDVLNGFYFYIRMNLERDTTLVEKAIWDDGMLLEDLVITNQVLGFENGLQRLYIQK